MAPPDAAPTATDRDDLARVYTALHEGRPPGKIFWEPYPAKDARVAPRARLMEIQYEKLIPADDPSYWHPYAPHAQPALGVDGRGEIRVWAGRYHTTNRGIEDLSRAKQTREHLPGLPNSLVDLGKLEWIKYKWSYRGREHIGIISFNRAKNPRGGFPVIQFTTGEAPVVAHDEHGDLHFIRGNYRIPRTWIQAHGAEAHMAHGAMHHAMRANPSERMGKNLSAGERAKRLIMGALIVGGVGTVGGIALNMGIQRFAPATWSPNVRAAVTIVGGVGLGLLAAYAVPKYPAVAAGFAVGGAVLGLTGLYANFMASRAAVVVPAPSAQAFLPMGGVPSGFQVSTPQACAVPGSR